MKSFMPLRKSTPLRATRAVMGSVRKGRDKNRFFTSGQKRQILERADWLCEACWMALEMHTANADHREPWARGGRTDLANGVALCHRCNKLKGNLSWDEFMERYARGER